jgi:c-di-GMP-binding flagellar brake protein YcgR
VAEKRERRASKRVQPKRSARIVDISLGGITIETAAPLRRGGSCELILQLDEHRMPVAARVLRLRRARDVVRASLVFERMLESDRRELEQALVRAVAERMTVIVR